MSSVASGTITDISLSRRKVKQRPDLRKLCKMRT